MNTKEFVARHVDEVPPSGIRKFFDIASTMKGVISLGVGEPDFITPWNVREAAITSLEKGHTHYTSNHGMPELRELVDVYLKDRYNLEYSLDETMITVGASEALDLAFRAIINPGDEILVPAPSYVSYQPGVAFAGGVPVPMDTLEENNFALTPENIESCITPKTKAIVMPYPNNPTGAIMTREQLEEVKKIVEKHNLLVIADEIYSELSYAGRHVSVAEGFEERTVLINGFSKAFAMTGWRLGYACGPKPIIDAMVKIHQYSMLCAPIMSQYAGIEALKYEMSTGYRQVGEMVSSYNKRRLFILDGLREAGLQCYEPKGAFYVFPNIKSTGLTSEQFCEQLLESKKIACAPGSAFGDAGEGYVRCSYASSMQNIMEAVSRIGEFVSEVSNR